MAGFFSLNSGRGKEEAREQQQQEENNNNQFHFRNEEIYNKGFEIWPQQHQQASFHHQQQHQQNINNFYSFGVGSSSRRNENTGNNLHDDGSVSFSDESTRFGLTVIRSGGGGGVAGGLGGGGMNCQDCGNQAKKDCPHLRCRTCCKSRGLQCQTHVKSTWVPAAKRRERQQQLTSLQQNQQHQFHSSRRQREINPNDPSAGGGASGSLACSPIPITSTGLEVGNFPPELNSPAVFRCVKVSALDAQDERYAYQTAVNIGGRVFKGILYDQGLEGNYTSANASGGGVGEGSSGGGGEGNFQNLITTATTNVSNPFEYSSLYPAPLNAFMAGTQFFPPPRS
ncbi:hypothetical protein TSUD_03160 [Trifolium subterraneum]|nr:hypothetical protein TSUD_03160 [Trifolium subterraneum]